jgi:2-dehydro-3-deoxyphosphogluconate aldolase/(4S)-4-hydroxy-2-oxoglutarate aldolase
MVKLFPGQTPDYVGLIHAPLNHIPLMVTGGVTVDNTHLYIRKGARAVGVGTYLTSLELNLAEVTARAARLKAALEQA